MPKLTFYILVKSLTAKYKKPMTRKQYRHRYILKQLKKERKLRNEKNNNRNYNSKL